MNSCTFGRFLVLALVGLMGCSDEAVDGVEPEPRLTAVAHLADKDGKNVGTVTFTETSEVGVRVNITIVRGGEPGDHGIHIHELGRCEPPDFTTAGEHFNPTNEPHGRPDQGPHHAGDLGNVRIEADGTGEETLMTDRLSLRKGEDHSILGRSVIFHQNPDDYMAQALLGNADRRLACGVITR